MDAALRTAARVCPFIARMATVGPTNMADAAGVPTWSGSTLLREATRCPVMARSLATAAAGAPKPPLAAAAAAIDLAAAHSTAAWVQQPAAGAKTAAAPQPLASGQAFAYKDFFQEQVEMKKRDRSYRYFNNINRLAAAYPMAKTGSGRDVTVWCSNDYLGMSRHPVVIDAIKYVVAPA